VRRVTAARETTSVGTPPRALTAGLARLSPAVVGWALVALAFAIYLLCNRQFNAGRGDFFYLADAFLNGRTWLEKPLGPWDDVFIGSHTYVPFAPFPAILVLPLVALVGPERADAWQPIVNAALAAAGVGACWLLAGRLGVRSLVDRFWIVVLYGFSTAIWWVTTRGGVWHTGHLVAGLLTLFAIAELVGRRRAWLVGLLGGAAFLTRSPLVLAMPFYALWYLVDDAGRLIGDGARAGARAFAARIPWHEWAILTVSFLPALGFFLWYNAARFGSPFESGYGLATLPDWLAARRALGLFSPVHLGMNIDLLVFHLPDPIPEFPWFRPDGHGMSILFTSPGLLLALRADWRAPRTWLLAGAALFVLIPSLLYYGGGWLQYGYRYALDSIPFVVALCALAAARVGIHPVFRVLILFGVLVNAAGVYWAYHL
jgi:hypothetical protein